MFSLSSAVIDAYLESVKSMVWDPLPQNIERVYRAHKISIFVMLSTCNVSLEYTICNFTDMT